MFGSNMIVSDHSPKILMVWGAEAVHKRGGFDIGKNEEWGDLGWDVDLGNFVNQSVAKLKKEINQLKLGTDDIMEYTSKSGCGTEAYVFRASPMGVKKKLFMAAWSIPLLKF